MDTLNQLIFWWSVISTILALLFLGWDIWQFSSSRKDKDVFEKEKDRHKAQVKIWQHYANGLSNSLLNISGTVPGSGFTSVNDVQQSIKALQTVSFYLYKSLMEERLFTDDEVKADQLKSQAYFDNFLKTNRQSTISNISEEIPVK